MKLFLGHPSGNQFFRNLSSALFRAGALGPVASCVNWNPRDRSWLNRLTPMLARPELARRSFQESWAADLRTHPWREAARLIAIRLGFKTWNFHETGWCSVDAVYRDFDLWIARQLPLAKVRDGVRIVYAYEDAAESTFIEAKSLGLARVYDLPIAYWEIGRRLMEEEAARLPQWAATLGGGVKDSPAKLARKTRELELADLVVTPSQFVADSLPEWARASKRVIVSPFGSPEPNGEKLRAMSDELGAHSSEPIASGQAPFVSTKRLRILFAGSMGQRKGLGDLFAAMRLLKRSDVELVVMGSLQAPMEFYRKEFPHFTYESGRSHAQVLELMRSCDVFCLPSIVEGRALVMQEAMSQGLPIIITPNTGGGDLVCKAHEIEAKSSELRAESQQLAANYGRSATGFLIPIRSPEAITEAIAWCADHRAETADMGRAARKKAATYTWEAYGDTVVAAIRGITSLQ